MLKSPAEKPAGLTEIRLTGVEPALVASEATALSVELQACKYINADNIIIISKTIEICKHL